MYSQEVQQLITRFRPILALGQAEGVLSWDQQVMMPAGGASARANTLGELATLSHQLLTAPGVVQDLAAAKEKATTKEENRLVELSQRAYDQASKIPEALATELARATSAALQGWEEARTKNRYDLFEPHLQTILDLTRQQAEALGYQEHIYDALLNLYEPGATHAQITKLFQELKPALLEMTQQIIARQSSASTLWEQEYPLKAQEDTTVDVLKKIGFDLLRGRQDISAHPFCTNFGRSDVRVTTRYDLHYLPMALYGSLHEMGHGLYEQGSPEAFEGTVLAGGVSLGVHESQSRLWENIVGRGLPFTTWLYPQLQKQFKALEDISLTQYYAAINQVQLSPIRVEADEVTYNLHILLRFELESALLTGELSVADLPAAWGAKMQEYFGILPEDNAHGVLQDVHWSIGAIGYFPTYTLGNLLSAQLYEAASQALPELDDQLEQGNFSPLLDWLHEHIHRYASLTPTNDLILEATGNSLSTENYLAYLRRKYLT